MSTLALMAKNGEREMNEFQEHWERWSYDLPIRQRKRLEWVLMAGAFEEGRLRGVLETISGMPAWHAHAHDMLHVADAALCVPTLEEGKR